MVTKNVKSVPQNGKKLSVMIDTALHGMKDIASYTHRSESTVLKWIVQAEFPASKVAGGIWVSDKLLIDDWFRSRILMG